MSNRNRKCDVCGAGLVANPRAGETTSNKEWSVEHKCPNAPHDGTHQDEDGGEVDEDQRESLDNIADKYFG